MKKRKMWILMGVTIIAVATFMKSTKAEVITITKRIAGATRYETCKEILDSGWTSSQNVIIASGENYPDALGAATLSHQGDAPILLVHGKSMQDNPMIIGELQRLNTKNIIILGGIGAVSQGIEDALKKSGYTVKRIAGADRYETAVKIAEQLENVSEIMIASGEDFAGSLSAAPVSGNQNIPVLLVSKNEIPASVMNFLKKHIIKTTYVLGDTSYISQVVADKFPNVKRISGNTRYSLNQNIVKNFGTPMEFSTVYTTTGESFADALSGVALAVKSENPILFVDKNNNDELKNILTGKNIKNNIILGGEGAVSAQVISALFKDLNNSANSTATNTSSIGKSTNSQANTSAVNTQINIPVNASANVPTENKNIDIIGNNMLSAKEKRAYLLGEAEKNGDFAQVGGQWGFTSDAAKKANLETITVKVWDYVDGKDKSKGKKTVSKTLTVNKKLSAVIKQIFQEIYDLPGEFPIADVGAFRPSDPCINHPAGSAIDINADSNYYVQVDKAGKIIQKVGSHYDPTNDPYSITPEVIKVFEKYGWEWGGNFPQSKDYMHFSYLGG